MLITLKVQLDKEVLGDIRVYKCIGYTGVIHFSRWISDQIKFLQSEKVAPLNFISISIFNVFFSALSVLCVLATT